MVEQAASVTAKYLQDLYQDLHIKSAVDVNATINIICTIEDLSLGKIVNEDCIYQEAPSLPGKSPKELINEFRVHAENQKLNLSDIFALRDSLNRYQSLFI